MSQYVNTLPQNIAEIKLVTLKDLIRVLPETLRYPMNVWIANKIVRFGVTTENLVFLIEQPEDPSTEIRLYFSSLVEPLGIEATASGAWRDTKFNALRLYNEGRLIIDKETLVYKEIPSQVREVPVITVGELKSKLPQSIQWTCTIWLTGGLVKNGWSANDIDLIVVDDQPRSVYNELREYFSTLLGWRVDVGTRVMPEREPVYLFRLYDGGSLCQL